jgi:hypothetical protein
MSSLVMAYVQRVAVKRRVALIGVGVLLIVGCASQPSRSPVAPRVGAARVGISASRLTSFTLRHQHSITHLALLPDWLLYTTCGDCREGSPPDQVRAINLTTRHRSVIAKSRYRHGMVAWVEGSGDVIVYVDQSREQTDSDALTKWTLTAKNLSTGRTKVLDSSHGRLADSLPLPYAGDGMAVWLVADANPKRNRIRVARLSTMAVHTLPTPRRAAEVGITDGHVVWADSHNGEVFSEDLTNHKTLRLSRKGRAGQVRAADGYAVWPTPWTGDPHRIWLAKVGVANSARLLFSGYNEQPLAGARFVVYFADYGSELDVISLHGGNATVIAHNPDVPSRYATDRNRVAFSTTRHLFDPGQITTLKVDTIN